jgi:hypothetical protein
MTYVRAVFSLQISCLANITAAVVVPQNLGAVHVDTTQLHLPRRAEYLANQADAPSYVQVSAGLFFQSSALVALSFASLASIYSSALRSVCINT